MTRQLVATSLGLLLFSVACGPGTSPGDPTLLPGETAPPQQNNASEPPCQDEAACAQGEQCVEGVCTGAPSNNQASNAQTSGTTQTAPNNNNNNMALRCTSDASCEPGEECSEQGECVRIERCEQSRDPLGYCARALALAPEDVACSVSGCVELYVAPLTAIQVLDLTSGAGCQPDPAGLSSPGADLIALELLSAQGETLGWGVVVGYAPGEGVNDFTSTAHINGLPADVDLDACPQELDGSRFRQDTITSLGCGGDMVVSFFDEGNTPVELVTGMQVAVMEYGPVCQGSPQAASVDEFEVYLCGDDNADAVIENTECLVLASDGARSGYVLIEVP